MTGPGDDQAGVPTAPDVNLLETGRRQMEPARLAALFNILAVLAAGFFLVMLGLLASILLHTRDLDRQLARAVTTLGRPVVLPKAVATVSADLEHTRYVLNNLEADMAGLSSRRVAWGTRLGPILEQVGQDIVVSTLRAEGLSVVVSGYADSLDALGAYVNRLRASGHYKDVAIGTISGTSTPEPGATLPLASVTPAAGAAAATPTPAFLAPPLAEPSATACVDAPRFPLWWFPWHLPGTQQPTCPPAPSATATTAGEDVRITNIALTPQRARVGDTLTIEVTIINVGTAPVRFGWQQLAGYTYEQGEVAPASSAGVWRLAADEVAYAANGYYRYRWGSGSMLLPGGSQRLLGRIRLTTPGTFRYCVALVQEPDSIRSHCQGMTVVSVDSVNPLRTPSPWRPTSTPTWRRPPDRPSPMAPTSTPVTPRPFTPTPGMWPHRSPTPTATEGRRLPPWGTPTATATRRLPPARTTTLTATTTPGGHAGLQLVSAVGPASFDGCERSDAMATPSPRLTPATASWAVTGQVLSFTLVLQVRGGGP